MRSNSIVTLACICVLAWAVVAGPAFGGTPAASPSAAVCGPGWARILTEDTSHDFILGLDIASKTDAWAVGEASIKTFIEHWNGSKWTVTPSPNVGSGTNSLNSVREISPNDVWAVGVYAGSTDYQTLIEHWDGGTWTVVASPNVNEEQNSLWSVDAVSATDIWAVGIYRDATSRLYLPLTEHWNGTAWTIVDTPSVGPDGAEFKAVTANASGLVLAAGTYSATDGHDYGLIEQFTAGHWEVITSTSFTGGGPYLEAITSTSASDAWAVGYLTNAYAEHYDGASWATVANPDVQGGSLYSVAALSVGDVWSVGVHSPQAHQRGLVEHWDGTAWSFLPEGDSTFDSISNVAAFSRGAIVIGYPKGSTTKQIVQMICPVIVGDSGFVPAMSKVAVGATTYWHVDPGAASSHSILDASGLGLFDSGLRAPGASFGFAFPGAGTYAVTDSTTGAHSKAAVSLRVTPPSGGVGDTYTIRWAIAPPPAGLVFDTQIRRPGTTGFVSWQPASTGTNATFVPDAGPGRYDFRTHIRTTTGTSSGWSPVGSFVAS